jgi:hypothetical protein
MNNENAFFILELLAPIIISLIIVILLFRVGKQVLQTKNDQTKSILKLTGLAFCFLIVLFIDLGLFVWIQTGSWKYFLVIVLLVICPLPLLLPIIMVGTLLQLKYRDLFREIINKNK